MIWCTLENSAFTCINEEVGIFCKLRLFTLIIYLSFRNGQGVRVSLEHPVYSLTQLPKGPLQCICTEKNTVTEQMLSPRINEPRPGKEARTEVGIFGEVRGPRTYRQGGRGEVMANESRGHNAGFISARKLSQVISRPKRGPRPLFYYFIAREVESGPLCIAKKRTNNTERIAKQDLK